MSKIWWLHSFGALAFGVGVMAFARSGLDYADKVLMVLALSWIFVFVAFRFIVGPANRKPNEKLVKKGVRLVTNYVIKQLYQQMFFFLVPLYASSATWTLYSPNWWIVPLLLLCAVLSTMDLVFDNFIMEHRNIAAGMYGLCMFAVLNLMLPLVFHVQHFFALMTAALVTPPAVALLSYPLQTVVRGKGLLLTIGCSVGLVAGCYVGRGFVPPAPMAMSAGGIGHGTPGSYECVPGPLRQMSVDQLDGLRCVSEVTEPGGINDEVVHVWSLGGEEIDRLTPTKVAGCPGEVLKSEMNLQIAPARLKGKLSCTVETGEGQLIGRLNVKLVDPGEAPEAQGKEGQDGSGAGLDAAPGRRDGGSASDVSAPTEERAASSGDAAP
jgi:hypothetical protein